MREILFRGKRKYNGEWIEGNLLTYADGTSFVCCLTGDEDVLDKCGVIPETVGQYTGLTDKNGKKIFEGDIIRYAYEDEYRMYLESLECPDDYSENAFDNLWTVDEVVYCVNVGYPAFDLNCHNFEANGLSELTESGCYHYEVIGNIHDNPELLKGGWNNG